MVFGSVPTLLFIAWHFDTASIPRKKERNIWVPFSVHVHLTVLELVSLEKKKKENDDFRFFQNSFSWLL